MGGDKEIPYLNLPSEPNPFLGYRAVRLYFERPEIYKPQLRAILRASCSGPVKIMFPMISSLEEARKGRAIVEEVKKELHEEGLRFTGAIDTGAVSYTHLDVYKRQEGVLVELIAVETEGR